MATLEVIERIGSGGSGEVLDIALAGVKDDFVGLGDVALDAARQNFVGFMAATTMGSAAPDRVTDEVWHQLIGLGDEAIAKFFESAGIAEVGHNAGFGRYDPREREALISIFGDTTARVAAALGQDELEVLNRAQGLFHEFDLIPEPGVQKIVSMCISYKDVDIERWKEGQSVSDIEDTRSVVIKSRGLIGSSVSVSLEDLQEKSLEARECVECPLNDNCLVAGRKRIDRWDVRNSCGAFQAISNAHLMRDEVLVNIPKRKLVIMEGPSTKVPDHDSWSAQRGMWELMDDRKPLLGPISKAELDAHKVA